MAETDKHNPGRMIGGYRVLDKLGEGGMGTVFIAEHELLGKKVAIKVLLPEHSQNPELVQRFFNEARAATRINHPGIVEIYDFGHDRDGAAYIVMEALRGESLAARLERDHRLAPEIAVRLMTHIADALGQAHREGIVHRDLKPDNIFVVPDHAVPGGERTKLLDFGIAKLAEAAASGVKTRAGAVIGTPAYMAPEQFRGAGSVDHRADIYALGVVLYEMLTGRPPFVANGIGELMEMHMFQVPPPPRSLVPAIPPALEAVVLRALAKRPEDRQRSVEELAAELATAIDGSAGPSARTIAIGDAATPTAATITAPPTAATITAPPGTLVLPPRRTAQTTLGAAAGHAVSLPPSTPHRARWIVAGTLAAFGLAIGVVVALRTGTTQPASVSPPPPDATLAVPAISVADAGPIDAAPIDAMPIDAAPIAAAAPALDAAVDARPDATPSVERPRPRPRPSSGSDACDRRIDVDCDGIPDVRLR
jgi:serine/threonine-protein kinase